MANPGAVESLKEVAHTRQRNPPLAFSETSSIRRVASMTFGAGDIGFAHQPICVERHAWSVVCCPVSLRVIVSLLLIGRLNARETHLFAPTCGTKVPDAADFDQAGAVAGAAILSFSSVQVLRTSAVISEQSSI
jgi:hypothetical protein